MLYVVGIGAGERDGMTIAAEKAILKSELIVGYTVYTDLAKKYFPDKTFVSTGMKQEKKRVLYALEKAVEGKTVSLICSGDSGVYGMACLALEMAENFPETEIEIVCGVTAALSGAAILGAPLTNDFVVISLSDLLTPWDKIEKRLECTAMADFAAVIYNPASKKRTEHLKKACDIMLRYKSPETVCGYAKNIGRDDQQSGILSLLEMRNFFADMFTTVFIGSSETKNINGRMVTFRGYNDE